MLMKVSYSSNPFLFGTRTENTTFNAFDIMGDEFFIVGETSNTEKAFLNQQSPKGVLLLYKNTESIQWSK